MVLKQAFRQLNREWFNDALPHTTEVKWSRMKEMGTFEVIGADKFVIKINRKMKEWPSAWKTTLLHEMIHAATADEPEAHGPQWLKMRDRLVRQGAFTPYL
jgi:SprT-like family